MIIVCVCVIEYQLLLTCLTFNAAFSSCAWVLNSSVVNDQRQMIHLPVFGIAPTSQAAPKFLAGRLLYAYMRVGG